MWKDIDLKAGTIAVRRAVAWLPGGEWQFGEPKTQQSRRTIPLPRSPVRPTRRDSALRI
jgi:hypothetical protein